MSSVCVCQAEVFGRFEVILQITEALGSAERSRDAFLASEAHPTAGQVLTLKEVLAAGSRSQLPGR